MVGTTKKYKGRTIVYYIVYEDARGRTRVKRVYISGKLIDYTLGTFRIRSGKKVYGVQFVYENPVKRKGRSKPIKVKVKKVVKIPRYAKNVRLTRKPPKGPLMNIA